MKGNKVCIFIILRNFRYQKSYINQQREKEKQKYRSFNSEEIVFWKEIKFVFLLFQWTSGILSQVLINREKKRNKKTLEVQIGRNCCVKGYQVFFYYFNEFRYQKPVCNHQREEEKQQDEGSSIWKKLLYERK